MLRKWIHFLYLGVLIGPSWAATDLDLPIVTFSSYGLEVALPHQHVYAQYQDKQGFLWIGTEAGLCKFDGRHLQVFDKNDKGKRLNISSIVADTSGSLWLGTWGSGLARLEMPTEQLTFFVNEAGNAASLSDDRVQALQSDMDGHVWIGTASGGINRIDPKTGHIARFPIGGRNGLPHARVWSIAQDAAGTLWVGTEVGLARLTRGATFFEPVNSWSTNPSQQVRELLVDSLGLLWLGTNEGLVSYDPQTQTSKSFSAYPDSVYDPRQNIVNTLIEDRSGRLWVGFLTGGLSVFDRVRERFSIVADQRNPIYDDIRSILEDRSGNIWVGTRGLGVRIFGASRRFEHFFHNPTDPNSLSGNRVSCFAEDETHLWVGTEFGLNRMKHHSQHNRRFFHKPGDPTSLPSDGISALLMDSKKNLWVGTTAGLSHFDPATESFQSLQRDPSQPASLPHQWVTCLAEGAHGKLWVGTRDGLSLFFPENKTFHNFAFDPEDPQSLPHSVILSVVEDASRRVWIGTEKGLCRFKNDGTGFVRYLDRPNNAHPNPLRVMAIQVNQSNPDQLLLATDQGLCQFDITREDVRFFGGKEGIPTNIQGLVQDPAGLLWLRSLDGVVRFDLISQRRIEFKSGLGFENHPVLPNSCYRSPEGWLAFGGASGFNKLYPNDMPETMATPTTVLNEVRVGNQHIQGPSLQHPLNLGPDENSLQLHFSLLDFSGEKPKFRYRLGESDTWSAPSSTPFVNFHKLSGGSYAFQVKGSLDDVVYSEPATLLFKIHIPWYRQSWWPWVAAVVALALVFQWLRRSKPVLLPSSSDAQPDQTQVLNTWQKRLELVATISDRGWFFIDGSDHIIWANQAARTLLGRSEEALFGTNAADLFPGSLSQAGNGTLLVVPRPDNQNLQIRVTVGNWPDGGGGYLYFEPTKALASPRTGPRVSGSNSDDWFISSPRPEAVDGLGWGWKLLGVDSQLKNRLILDQWLGNLGFEVISAENGHRAIELTLREQPHLVLLGISANVDDMLEVLGFIRMSSKNHCWVIAVIPQELQGDPRFRAFDAVCVRPMRYDQLFGLIRDRLKEKPLTEKGS